jgi:hypothetical protein
VTGRLFRQEKDSGAGIALISDSPDGPFIQADGATFQPIPGWMVWSEWILGAAAFLLMASSLLFALVWVPRKLLGKLRGVRQLSVRLAPLISVLALAATVGVFALARDDLVNRFGKVSVWSVAFWALTLVFATTAFCPLS